MTKKATVKKTPVKTVPLTRAQLRDALLGHAPKPKTIPITLFGIDIDLTQSSLGSILDIQDVESPKERGAFMIIQYACVPGTTERIFEDADREMILAWPYGDDLTRLQEAVAELTGIDISGATEDLEKDPLKEQS